MEAVSESVREQPLNEVRVHLVGEFVVEGVASRDLGSRKARRVLKVLALDYGRAVSSDRLIEAIWPVLLPANPADQLAVLISRLRGVLGRDRITFSDAGYRLHADWVDLVEFSDWREQAERAAASSHERDALIAAQAALKLADEPLLADELDASWALHARRAHESAVARLRHIAATAALSMGDAAAAAAVAGAAIAADPFDEEALRHLMLAEQRRGCAAAGLAAYGRVRAYLAEELGVDPSPATEAVHLALLRESEPVESLRNPRFTEIPQPVLVGRAVELGLLDSDRLLVSDGPARLVVVEGEAGIGKSALVNEGGRRAEVDGWLWLHGTCEQLFGELPMQSVVDAVAAHVASLSPVAAAALLAGEQSVLGPLVGAGTHNPVESWAGATGGEQRLARAFDAVFARLTTVQPVMLSVDDVHLAAPSTIELLTYLSRRRSRLLVVVARRRGSGPSSGTGFGATRTIHLGPLELADAIGIVGVERGADLHARSGGNPLFLTLLAGSDPSETLPTSIVEVVAGIADGLGRARGTVRAAAVLGRAVDVELLAGVLQVAPVELLAELEAASERRLLDSYDDGYVFRHELVRIALAETATSAGAALLHREAARILHARSGADQLQVAHHAQLGGNLELAADALEAAAVVAARRFDRRAAEDLLDQALRWSDTPGRRLARARTRTMRGHYDAALVDVDAAIAAGAGAAALEVGAWAAYFGRRLDLAQAFGDDGASLAADRTTRASCLAVAGRVRHARGDLAGAEPILSEAVATAEGPARAIPTVWLGVLRSHQSRCGEALALLRQITRVESPTEHTAELLHALLFTAHSFALQTQPLDALDALVRYDAELAVRQVPRFAGRAANFRGWVLRALGQWERADDENRRAVDELADVDFPETRIAAALDLASSALLRRDASEADAMLTVAESNWTPQLTFGWRLDLRIRLERARLALLGGNAGIASEMAAQVAADAARLSVPRYERVARLVTARAQYKAGSSVDLDAASHDLDALDEAIGIDAWWVTAEAARDFGVVAWHDQARARADHLAQMAGPEGHAVATAVARLLG